METFRSTNPPDEPPPVNSAEVLPPPAVPPAPAASAVDDEPFQFRLSELFLLVACLAIVLGVLIRIGWLLLGAYLVYCAYLTILLIPYILWLTLRRTLDGLSLAWRRVRYRNRPGNALSPD
jgi:hypothetical protein